MSLPGTSERAAELLPQLDKIIAMLIERLADPHDKVVLLWWWATGGHNNEKFCCWEAGTDWVGGPRVATTTRNPVVVKPGRTG